MVNVKDVQLGTTTRKSFAKINEVMKMPNLIEVQKSSYRWFLEEGLKEVFKDIGEIRNYFGYKSVYYTVSTAGAIVGGHVCQSVRSFKFRH